MPKTNFSGLVRQLTNRQRLKPGSDGPKRAYPPYANPPQVDEELPHRHFFYDTEFMETGGRGKGEIQIISIGIVDEDGRTFYAINREADLSRANEFVAKEVIPKLPPQTDPAWMCPEKIAHELLEFILPDGRPPHLWTWYGCYDHVVMCWLWGQMVDLPEGLPMFTRDLKPMLPFFEAVCGAEIEAPPKPKDAHDALSDARWLQSYWRRVEKACEGMDWFEEL